MSANTSDRKIVKCIKLDQELPGLAKPPFAGEIGQKIFDNISQQAWDMWKDLQIKILNEYRLNLADPDDYQVLIDQMLAFLNIQPGDTVEVENEKRGRK